MKRLLPLLLVLVALPAFAQRGNLTPEERRDRLETVVIGKFATELELSSEQAEKFFPMLRSYRRDSESTQEQLQESRRRLNAISQAPDAESKEVKELIAKTNSLQAQLIDRRSGFLSNIADVLTPQQVSRCSILLDELPRRMHEFMEEHRGKGVGGPPKGGPPAKRRGY